MTQSFKLTLALCATLWASVAVAGDLPRSVLGLYGTSASICANPDAGVGSFVGIERQGKIVNLTFIDTGAKHSNCIVGEVTRSGRGYNLAASCFVSESMRTRSSFKLWSSPYGDAVTLSMAGPGDPVQTYQRCH